MDIDQSAEILRLRATVRDLLALSIIPEAWVGRAPPAIAADLADLLIGSLKLDFAFVRLGDPIGCRTVEVIRGDAWRGFPEWLQQRFVKFGQVTRTEIVTNVGGAEKSCCGVVIPIGVNSERGLIAAACDRSGFPDQIDQQLLSVAANNAATAFQNAFLINELRSAQEALRNNEQEIRKARDELEIKVAERTAELRKSEKELRDVIDTIPAAVWSALPDGSNTYANKRFVEYLGLSAEQTVGSGWQAAIHPDDLERHAGKWMEAVATGKPHENESRYRRSDGQYRWHLDRGVPLRGEDGNIVKWYGVATDIEDRKRAEHERERLRQLEAELAHVNRVSMLGEMAASLAHEIKQPIAAALTSASSCIEWLAHEPPNLDRARAAAAKIDKYGNRAAEIIDRIRSLYRKCPPQRELVEVNGIIEEMFTLLKGEATRFSIAMRTDLSAELPKIMVDRVQLQQVFMNLMLNGIEAMADSGGELTVKSQLQDGQLQFSVSDTGVGLPTEKMDQIFSAFFTTKPQGSGMGLAISRSIVESHGGRLWASANKGGGATFHFTLPIQVTESSPLVA
jgi:PAS domain S-box-containing protein